MLVLFWNILMRSLFNFERTQGNNGFHSYIGSHSLNGFQCCSGSHTRVGFQVLIGYN